MYLKWENFYEIDSFCYLIGFIGFKLILKCTIMYYFMKIGYS